MTTTYTLTGFVLGNYWGGGTGAYPATKLEGDNLDKLISEANTLLKTGGLDSGMGFESLIGAVFIVKVQLMKIIDGKNWVHTKYASDIHIGELTEKQTEHLFFCLYTQT